MALELLDVGLQQPRHHRRNGVELLEELCLCARDRRVDVLLVLVENDRLPDVVIPAARVSGFRVCAWLMWHQTSVVIGRVD